jgi:iron complex transport system ATP-binding protein
MEPVIECSHVSFSYGSGEILRDINLRFAGGKLLGILGANGAGKSTLLKILTGILRAQKGSVRFDSKPLLSYDRREIAKRIAYIPQDPVFAFPFTVSEVILMGRAPYIGRFEFEREIDRGAAERAMDTVGVSHLRDRLITETSSGERQLASIARALVQEPRVMILDEPATFLDIKHRNEIMGLLRKLKEERGILIIAATHDIFTALFYFDEIVMIKNGGVFAEGPVDAVINRESLSSLYGIDVTVRKEGGKVFIYPGD